jgi:hypothetical protein
MTSLPHPVPSRMAHTVAALYGVEDDTLVACHARAAGSSRC